MPVKPKVQSRDVILVVGAGNLGAAIIRGLCKSGYTRPSNVIACDPNPGNLKRLANELGIKTTTDAAQVAAKAAIILIALKPNLMVKVVSQLSPLLRNRKLVVSVAAGIRLIALKQAAGKGVRIMRAMPNVASAVSEAVTGLYSEDRKLLPIARKLFASLGTVVILDREDDVDVVTALGASSQAYGFTFINSLADGAVKMGLKKEVALVIATQAIRGATAMLAASRKRPGELSDTVTSPGGTTIAGLHELEKRGFRGAVISAMEAAVERAQEISKKYSPKYSPKS